MPPQISVIIPTHNPNAGRLQQTLDGLRGQTLPAAEWELVVIDNASRTPPEFDPVRAAHPSARIVREEQLGLTAARIRGIREAKGDILVMVDDDNVLHSNYLAEVEKTFRGEPELGAIGGRSIARFESAAPTWLSEFSGLLAVRDLGTETIRAKWTNGQPREYPKCSPIGAGMALRKACGDNYVREVTAAPHRIRFDRTGQSLTSGGDNDIVMSILEQGWTVAYVPLLTLTHLIPQDRCEAEYLARLNRAIARSWVRVLALHGIRPWRTVHPWTTSLRQLRAWWRLHAWAGPAQRIRWQGACGQFEGQADVWIADRAPARTQ